MIWRKTNKKTSLAVVVVSIAIFLFWVYVSFCLSWDIAPIIITDAYIVLMIITGCFGILMICVWISFRMRTEWERELVIEEKLIRWGHTKRPDKQKSLPVTAIKALHHHFGMDGDLTFFKMFDGEEVSPPADIVFYNHDSFVRTICECFPGIEVIDGRASMTAFQKKRYETKSR